MNKYLLKFYIKNGIYIFLILLFAVVSTMWIYNKFSKENSSITPTEHLEVTFHDKEKNKISITKVNPVSDAIGLSFNANTISIKNNTDKKLKFVVKILDDIDEYNYHGCINNKLPHGSIKIAYHKNKDRNSIVLLNTLVDDVLVSDEIDAGDETNYTVRLWIDNNTNLNLDKNSHYHGLIIVEEIKET